MATGRTRSVASLYVAWATILMLPCSVFSLSDHCSVSKILGCEETHEYAFQSGTQFDEDLNCLFSFSTANECNMAITVRDVKMAPPEANGECTLDRLQVYDLENQELVPGNIYCGTGAGKNATELNEMSSNVGLVVFTSRESKTPRSFRLMVSATRMEAPGTEETPGTGPPGTEGSEPPGGTIGTGEPGTEEGESTGPTTRAPGGSGQSTGPTTGAPGGSGESTVPTTGAPGGSGESTVPTTGAPGGSGNSTAPRPGGNTTRIPAGGNGTVTGPPGGGIGGDETVTGPPGGGAGANETLPTPRG